MHRTPYYVLFLYYCYFCIGKNTWNPLISPVRPSFSRSSAGSTTVSFKPSQLVVRKANNSLILSNSIGEVIHLHVSANGSLIIAYEDIQAESSSTASVQTADAVYGIYEFSYGYYLALITSSEPALSFLNDYVRKVRELTLIPIPFANNTIANDLYDKKMQRDIENLLLNTFSIHSFYYSIDPSFSITKCLQQQNHPLSSSDVPSWRLEDRKFIWNYNLNLHFISRGLFSWVTPVTNAWADHRSVNILDWNVTIAIISRRSSTRQGLRYIKRGSDKDGNVANFALTEQLVHISQNNNTSAPIVTSFAQLRGSIPLLWHQPDVWKLKPSIIIERNLTAHISVLRKHLHDVVKYLQPLMKPGRTTEARLKDKQPTYLYFLNLIDKKGQQGRLGQTLSYCIDQLSSKKSKRKLSNETSQKAAWSFQSFFQWIKWGIITSLQPKQDDFVDQAPETFDVEDDWKDSKSITKIDRTIVTENQKASIKYIWFDYHSKVKKRGVTSALNELYSVLRPSLQSLGLPSAVDQLTTQSNYYMTNDKNEIVRMQSSIVRTNCIDCLDRTNVVQTTIARWMIIRQFKDLGIWKADDVEDSATKLPAETLEEAFRSLWCDHGDNLSLLYAGTRALKRDVTLQGKRTGQGAIVDGMNSVLRYYLNNRVDPLKQRGLDIVLGSNQDISPPMETSITSSFTPRTIRSINKWKAGTITAKISSARKPVERKRVPDLIPLPQLVEESSTAFDIGEIKDESSLIEVDSNASKQLDLDDMLDDLLDEIRGILAV